MFKKVDFNIYYILNLRFDFEAAFQKRKYIKSICKY